MSNNALQRYLQQLRQQKQKIIVDSIRLTNNESALQALSVTSSQARKNSRSIVSGAHNGQESPNSGRFRGGVNNSSTAVEGGLSFGWGQQMTSNHNLLDEGILISQNEIVTSDRDSANKVDYQRYKNNKDMNNKQKGQTKQRIERINLKGGIEKIKIKQNQERIAVKQNQDRTNYRPKQTKIHSNNINSELQQSQNPPLSSTKRLIGQVVTRQTIIHSPKSKRYHTQLTNRQKSVKQLEDSVDRSQQQSDKQIIERPRRKKGRNIKIRDLNRNGSISLHNNLNDNSINGLTINRTNRQIGNDSANPSNNINSQQSLPPIRRYQKNGILIDLRRALSMENQEKLGIGNRTAMSNKKDQSIQESRMDRKRVGNQGVPNVNLFPNNIIPPSKSLIQPKIHHNSIQQSHQPNKLLSNQIKSKNNINNNNHSNINNNRKMSENTINSNSIYSHSSSIINHQNRIHRINSHNSSNKHNNPLQHKGQQQLQNQDINYNNNKTTNILNNNGSDSQQDQQQMNHIQIINNKMNSNNKMNNNNNMNSNNNNNNNNTNPNNPIIQQYQFPQLFLNLLQQPPKDRQYQHLQLLLQPLLSSNILIHKIHQSISLWILKNCNYIYKQKRQYVYRKHIVDNGGASRRRNKSMISQINQNYVGEGREERGRSGDHRGNTSKLNNNLNNNNLNNSKQPFYIILKGRVKLYISNSNKSNKNNTNNSSLKKQKRLTIKKCQAGQLVGQQILFPKQQSHLLFQNNNTIVGYMQTCIALQSTYLLELSGLELERMRQELVPLGHRQHINQLEVLIRRNYIVKEWKRKRNK